MTDDVQEQQEKTTSTPSSDPFEVKWRKKNEPNARPAVEPAQDTPSDGTDVATLQRKLADAEARIQDLQDKWYRAQADLANFRKRVEAEREDVERYASMHLVAYLLPVLDNFERALATIPGNLRMLSWIQGVALIEHHLRSILAERGVSPIEAQGQPFNPHLHEAIGERATSEAAPGTIVGVYQQGYIMYDRVIRPALVEIAQQPSAPSNAETPVETAEEDAQGIARETESENPGP